MQLEQLLERSQSMVRPLGARPAMSQALAGSTVANLFTEPSTRTRVSFELAAKRLGADVVNLEVQLSSRVKGESMLDTIYTLAVAARGRLRHPRRRGRRAAAGGRPRAPRT